MRRGWRVNRRSGRGLAIGRAKIRGTMEGRFDTKLAIVLDESLAVWQKANVTAFLISGLAATDPALVGEPYADATGKCYAPMCREPILVYAADASGLRRVVDKVVDRLRPHP